MRLPAAEQYRRVLAYRRTAVESPNLDDINALLLHLLAHDKVSDHLAHKDHHELASLGARLARIALAQPD